MNNKYKIVGLYDHNANSYEQVKASFDAGNNISAIVHATGTGKTYNALQLAYDNKDKKIIYVVPSNNIIEHINKIIEDNPNLDLNKDFPNLEFRTYQSFISLSFEDIAKMNCDLLILDEFHHIGAPVWGSRINTLVETHPDIKIFGMTAYTVRDRGTPYERDMANPDTNELFSGKITSRYDLCDAMIDGVLPKPVYKSAYTNLLGLESQLEEKLKKLNTATKEYQEYMTILSNVKKRIHEAPSIPNILKKSIKPDGKYIYFCPPYSEERTNDIETIKKEVTNWFKQFIPEENIMIYTSTSEMGIEGKKNRDAFYNDVTLDGQKVDNKLRIMFAINQYNEGVHAPNIDGVIMGRGTTSDIVYFEQLGRALAVRGDTKEKFDELEKYTIEQLKEMCHKKDIPIKDNSIKEELIEKLIAPIVIDLTNNLDFIKELENNLKNRIKEIQTSNLNGNHRHIKIQDASFDIEIENQDLFEMLRYVMDKLTMTWEDKYNLAKEYYIHHGNLKIPTFFKTINGYEYDENGMALDTWIKTQREAYRGTANYKKLSPEQIQLLKEIGMIFNPSEENWMEMYNLAKEYYIHHGNLKIPKSFKTINGYEYNENGVALGNWIQTQKQMYKNKILSSERMKLLEEIGMIFNLRDENWMEIYNLAKEYYIHHGNLKIPLKFKTINGYEYDENGVALGRWIKTQRDAYKGINNIKLSSRKLQLLKEIGMIFNPNEENWMEMYNLAKEYYIHYKDLKIPQNFKTINGYEYDENGLFLGRWIKTQRDTYKGVNNRKLSSQKLQLLKEIGMIFGVIKADWMNKYNLAKEYYNHYGNLKIPMKFKTINGYEYDDNGVNLGIWIQTQRNAYKITSEHKISPEQIKLLEEIEIEWFNGYDERYQQEPITSKNLKKKKLEIQNRLYSVLNNYDNNSIPSKEELNQEFIKQLTTNKKL